MDQLVEEAETLHDRIDAAIKLLPSSEALYFARASTVPSFSVTSSPHHTQDPNPTHQHAQGTEMEIRSHPLPQEQQHLEDLGVVAPADHTTLPTRVSSAAPGFSVPPQPPSHPPLLANPSLPSYDQLNPFLPSSSHTNPVSSFMEQSLKLPAFEIPTFHGDVDRFFEFWDLFSMAVHNNPNVPAPLKFMYLKAHLRGPAANIIAGFQSTAENYEDAVRTLTNTYGRPEILRNRLWDKLMQLSPASDSSMSQRATLCGIKAIWAQLKHLKEDSSAIGTLKIIRAKFPRRTREKIGEFKKRGDSMWSVDELLETLDSIIDRLENIEDADPSDYHSYNSQSVVRQHSPSPRRYPSVNQTDPAFTRYRSSSYYPRRPSTSRSPSPYSRRDRPPTPYYPRRTSRSPSISRAQPEFRCAFCNSYHPSERCRIVSEIAQRRMIVIRNNLCWLCLQSGHTYTRCDAPLCSCGRVHHRALCQDYVRLPRSPTPPARRSYSRPRYASSPRRVQFDRDNYPSSSRAGASPTRRYYSKSISPSRRQSTTPPSRRATSARRSRSPTSAVHSATCTSQSPDTAMLEPRFDHHQASVGTHSPSSCTSVCYEKSLQQEPRLMVVHAITKNYNLDVDELLTVFLDSGSQYGFICTSLAKHLGLTFRNTKSITTLTFGGHSFTERSSEVTLVLWDQHNHPVELDLWTRETITTVPRANTQNDTDIVDLGDRVEVDVLIGIDNYWHIVDLHKNERLPSGLTLSQTRFGPVLSGLKCPATSNTLATISTLFADDEPRNEQLLRSLLGLDLLGLDEKEDAEDAKVVQQFYDTDICGFHAQVPRFICYSQHDMYDLVVCSDASKRVYAVAIYILAQLRNSSTKSSLLFAKAKLAPSGAITIPRMELLACHMAAKMARFVVSQLKVRFRSVKFLTDSQIVLYWMQSRKPLKTYVQNRVKYIGRVRDEFKKEQIDTGFYYLSSELNPADCATRGLTASQLQDHMWWNGPSFFRVPFSQWPCTKFQPSFGLPAGAETEELHIPRITAASAVETKGGYKSFIRFTRTNSYAKLVRITAYVLKYLAKLRVRAQTHQNIRHRTKSILLGTIDTTPTITADDFTTAELVLIREHYRESELQMRASYVNNLKKIYDTDGIIRVDLRMARLTYNMPQKIVDSSSDNYHALQTRYKELQSDLDSFWNIWQQEYLAVLAEREAKRVKDRPTTSFPKVGDVVLIRQDAPRSNWPLGLILELYTSSDGNTRSAKIKTGKRRVVDRSISHLLPLEVVAENEEAPQRGYQKHLLLKDNLQGTSKA
ncbi:unnamed protein product [Cylicocyclus nassatus]|uniref:DUF5641 domain-containing protein n=1 Tax=Cylicocyclus nassatus TaxID=53992 RepID=A0AA36H1K4_CYLNA|nr:unnamed protein product [Cylicocyclus nassatus]